MVHSITLWTHGDVRCELNIGTSGDNIVILVNDEVCHESPVWPEGAVYRAIELDRYLHALGAIGDRPLGKNVPNHGVLRQSSSRDVLKIAGVVGATPGSTEAPPLSLRSRSHSRRYKSSIGSI